MNKVKGQTFAKIVWIIGVLFTGFLAYGGAMNFKNEVTASNVCAFIEMFLYSAALVAGLVYLFKADLTKAAQTAGYIYAAAGILWLIDEVTNHGKSSAIGWIYLIANVLVAVLFAFTVTAYIQNKRSGIFDFCTKYWWLPSLVSIILAFIQSIITEVNDTHGFDFSLVVMDVCIGAFILLPIVTMTIVVKNRTAIASKD